MINFNKDAYGQKIRVNFGQDISSASAFTMTIEPRVGEEQNLTPTLGTSDVNVGDERYLQNQYVEYTITDGQFDDYEGIWRKKATALVGTEMIAVEYDQFRVMPGAPI